MNKRKLKSILALRDVSIKELAEKTKIGYANLRLKVNGKVIFKPNEIAKIKEVLELADNEVVEIFIN